MRSTIKVEIDGQNNPFIEIISKGSPYSNGQDLTDKLLAIMLKDIDYFKVQCTGGGQGIKPDDNYTMYELIPVKKTKE